MQVQARATTYSGRTSMQGTGMQGTGTSATGKPAPRGLCTCLSAVPPRTPISLRESMQGTWHVAALMLDQLLANATEAG